MLIIRGSDLPTNDGVVLCSGALDSCTSTTGLSHASRQTKESKRSPRSKAAAGFHAVDQLSITPLVAAALWPGERSNGPIFKSPLPLRYSWDFTLPRTVLSTVLSYGCERTLVVQLDSVFPLEQPQGIGTRVQVLRAAQKHSR
jgi:hypothetical protein